MTQAEYLFSESEMLEGNDLPGIPKNQIFLQLIYQSNSEWQLQLTGEHVGAFFADNANATQVAAYQKVRLQGVKTFALGKLEINLYGGIKQPL